MGTGEENSYATSGATLGGLTAGVGPVIPSPRDRPTLTIPEVAAMLNISRSHAYEQAAEGRLPVMRLGRRVLVMTDALLRMLGLDEPADK